MGYVTLEPDGGQVPWHNQEQEEIYFVLEGKHVVLDDAARRLAAARGDGAGGL